MTVSIRDARPDDAATIAGFNRAMALETENLSLDSATILNGVTRLLENPANGRYWLAEIDGEIVGQIMVTWEWSDWRDGQIWWIQSVYVEQDARRQGVFSALYHHVRDQVANAPDARGLRLYVEKDNTRAQATYEALGMDMTHYLVMEEMIPDYQETENA